MLLTSQGASAFAAACDGALQAAVVVAAPAAAAPVASPTTTTAAAAAENIVHQSSTSSVTLVMDILKPFLQIIVSEDTTGPITGVALQSIQKFLEFPWITPQVDGSKYIME